VKLTTTICFFILSIQSFGQVNVDSLTSVWANKKNADTTRLNAMHEIAWKGFLFRMPDSALYYAGIQFDFAKKKGLKGEMARALKTKGVSFYLRQDFEKAIIFYQRSLALYEKAKMPNGSIGDEKGIASINNNLGVICQELGNQEEAIQYHEASLKAKKKLGDQEAMATSYINIGNVLSNQGNYAKAIGMYTKALRISEKGNNIKGISSCLNNIGIIYKDQGNYDEAINYYNESLKILTGANFKGDRINTLNNLGSAYMEKGDYNGSLEFYELSLTECRTVDYKRGEAANLNNIGSVFWYQNDYPKALDYYNRSLSIRREIEDTPGIANSLSSIAIAHHSTEEYPKAIEFNLLALAIADSSGFLVLKREILFALYGDYKMNNNPKKALNTYEEYIVVRDSIASDENKQEVIRQKYKYEYEKKSDAERIRNEENLKVIEAEKEREQTKKYALYGGLALLLVFVGFMYNRFRITRKQKRIIEFQKGEVEVKNKEIESSLEEKETLLKEIHHRVKNNLQVISSLLSLQADRMDDKKALKAIQESQSRVKSMALVHQNLYQTDHLSNIEFQRYLEQLIGNMSASNKTAGQEVAMVINANGHSFNIETAVPLGLIVNELVSNAYKHAFTANAMGRIDVTIRSISDGIYYLTVSDNGKGIEGEIDVKKSKSLGLKLVNILSRQLKGKLNIKYEGGTAFEIEFQQISKSK